MRMLAVFYRTQDGRADYYFSFEEQPDGSWRAFILSQPTYEGRSTSLHDTHRLTAGGRHYVCWTTPLMSLKAVQDVAALWADKTQTYIATGSTF